MKKYKLNNLDCASCASKIESSLSKLEDVKFVTVNFANATMTIDTDNLDKVKAQIKKLEPDVEIQDVENEKSLVSVNELVENKGTITADSEVVKILKKRGWKWGGDYKSLKDYQHFDKILK